MVELVEHAALHARHTGRPRLDLGTLWHEESGEWRYACPLGCAVPHGEAFARPAEAARAYFAHWLDAQRAELAELARLDAER